MVVRFWARAAAVLRPVIDLCCTTLLATVGSTLVPRSRTRKGVTFATFPPPAYTRFAALSTARTLAVAMSASIPTPNTVRPSPVRHST